MTPLSASDPDRRGTRHDWNDFQQYLHTHEQYMEQLRYEGVVDDTLRWLPDGDGIRLYGRIRCSTGVYLDVDKRLEFNHRGQVRTWRYSYQAMAFIIPERHIFRYDNFDVKDYLGHPDAFHKHVWHPVTRKELTCRHIGIMDWPTLDEAVRELIRWSHDHPDLVGQA